MADRFESDTVFEQDVLVRGDLVVEGDTVRPLYASTGVLNLDDLPSESTETFPISGAAGRILMGAYIDVHEQLDFSGGAITNASLVTGVTGSTNAATTTVNLGGLTVGRHALPLGARHGSVISDDVIVTVTGVGGNLDGIEAGQIEVVLLTAPAYRAAPEAV